MSKRARHGGGDEDGNDDAPALDENFGDGDERKRKRQRRGGEVVGELGDSFSEEYDVVADDEHDDDNERGRLDKDTRTLKEGTITFVGSLLDTSIPVVMQQMPKMKTHVARHLRELKATMLKRLAELRVPSAAAAHPNYLSLVQENEKLDRNIFESSTELERLKEERDGQRKELSSEKNSVKAFLEERAKLEMRTEQLHKGKLHSLLKQEASGDAIVDNPSDVFDLEAKKKPYLKGVYLIDSALEAVKARISQRIDTVQRDNARSLAPTQALYEVRDVLQSTLHEQRTKDNNLIRHQSEPGDDEALVDADLNDD